MQTVFVPDWVGIVAQIVTQALFFVVTVISCFWQTGNELPRLLFGRVPPLSSSPSPPEKTVLTWLNNPGNIFSSINHLNLQLLTCSGSVIKVLKCLWTNQFLAKFVGFWRDCSRLDMAKSKNHTNHNQGEYLTSVTCVSVYFSELKSLWHIYFNLIHFVYSFRPQMAQKWNQKAQEAAISIFERGTFTDDFKLLFYRMK